VSNKTAKIVYIVLQTIFGIPAFGYIVRTIYRMATIPIPQSVDSESATIGIMVVCAILFLVAWIGVMPSVWHYSRRNK
jgi:hypothetical protein